MAGNDAFESALRAQQSMMAAGGKPSCVLGILPNVDVTGGFQLQTCGIGSKPISGGLLGIFANGGAYSSKGQQGLLQKLVASIHEDLQKMKNEAGVMYAGDLPAGSNISSGIRGGGGAIEIG